MKHRQYGRLPAPDDRDHGYSVLRLGVKPSGRTSRYWPDNRWWGDQGSHPHCVAYAWLHFLSDGPVYQRPPYPNVKPPKLYDLAQTLDEFPGDDYDGTSVRGGAKALRRLGYVGDFLWAFDLAAVVNTILEVGPVVIGVNWYEGMERPNRAGVIRATGKVLGGHAVVLNGVNTSTAALRVKNSWGRSWGNEGRASLPFEDFERLLREDGEACLATEIVL